MRTRTAAARLAACIAGSALVLGACGDAPARTGSGATVPRSATVTGAPAMTAQPATVPAGATPGTAVEPLRFSATLVDGSTLDLATLSGTPVVLWFWAPT